jgi:glycosyltransferase involved in cell wall biosynthesis
MQSEAAVSSPALCAFILAKNEQANIVRCLDGLRGLGIEVVVLDSGSTDGTQAIAAKYEYVRVENYTFVDHLTAYNDICTRRMERGAYVLILDADMIVTPELCREIKDFVTKGEVQVAQAPIGMWSNGLPLKHGSLYPPKPILFRAGVEYFLPVGHDCKLRSGVPVATTRHELIHDDRKPYLSYLQSQARYSNLFLARAKVGQLSWRDKLRCRTPLMLFLVPLYSLLVRCGFLSGRLGLVYALDRLIAEAIFFRQALASRLPEAVKEEGKNV